MEMMRLNKYLASCGVCSRRDADKLIESGEVFVNNLPAQMGMLVDGSEEIYCAGRKIRGQEKKVVLLYNKPVGVTCTEKDEHAERTIATEVDYPIRVTYAGRLDKESKGLLILTNDGDLIDEMMRGANNHEKEYAVRVNKTVLETDLEKLAKGIYLPDLGVKTKPCKVRKTGERTFRIILTQGLNRQIRRMCNTVGYHVASLTRVRVVNLQLGNLEEGQYREATEEEVKRLWEALRVQAPKKEQGSRDVKRVMRGRQNSGNGRKPSKEN